MAEEFFDITPPINAFEPDQIEMAENLKTYRFEILEPNKPRKENANPIELFDFTINPQEYQMHEPTRQGTTQTLGGAWVDFYGLGLPRITMSGTTGWFPFAKRATNTKPTGLAEFIRLRNTIFRKYAVLLNDKNKYNFEQRIQNQLQLRFYAWDTRDYVVVLIDDFILKRNAQRPLLYDYQITMTVIGHIGNATQPPDPQSDNFDLTNRFTKIGDALKTNSDALQDAIKTVASVSTPTKNLLQELDDAVMSVYNIIQNGADFTGTTLGSVQQIVDRIQNLDNIIANTLALPINIRNEIINILHETNCAISGLLNVSIYQKAWEALVDGTPWKHLNCSSTMTIPVTPLPVNRATGVSSRAPATQYRLKDVTVTEGDTLEGIMNREGVSPDVVNIWQEIVSINNLEYPYITQDTNFVKNINAIASLTLYGVNGTVISEGTLFETPTTDIRESVQFVTMNDVTIVNGKAVVNAQCTKAGEIGNVEQYAITEIVNAISGLQAVTNKLAVSGGKIWRILKPGDKVKIPVVVIETTSQTFVSQTQALEISLFGIDLALDNSGDFEADTTGDFVVVSGLINVETAMKDRLGAEQGELIKHLEYGIPIDRIIGRPGDKNAVTVAELEIARSISLDKRIKSIDAVNVKKSNDVINVEINSTLIDEVSRSIIMNL